MKTPSETCRIHHDFGRVGVLCGKNGWVYQAFSELTIFEFAENCDRTSHDQTFRDKHFTIEGFNIQYIDISYYHCHC